METRGKEPDSVVRGQNTRDLLPWDWILYKLDFRHFQPTIYWSIEGRIHEAAY